MPARKKEIAVETAPTVPKALIEKAIARKAVPALKKELTFTNRFAQVWSEGLGKFNNHLVVFKSVYEGSPHYATDPFGTKYCDGFDRRKEVVLALYIPKDAFCALWFGYGGCVDKCRTERAFVLGKVVARKIVPLKPRSVYSSPYRKSFTYANKAWCTPDKPFSHASQVCESGIHFYLTVGKCRQ